MLGLAKNDFKTCGVPHSMLKRILPKRIKYRYIIQNEALLLGVGPGVLHCKCLQGNIGCLQVFPVVGISCNIYRFRGNPIIIMGFSIDSAVFSTGTS